MQTRRTNNQIKTRNTNYSNYPIPIQFHMHTYRICWKLFQFIWPRDVDDVCCLYMCVCVWEWEKERANWRLRASIPYICDSIKNILTESSQIKHIKCLLRRYTESEPKANWNWNVFDGKGARTDTRSENNKSNRKQSETQMIVPGVCWPSQIMKIWMRRIELEKRVSVSSEMSESWKKRRVTGGKKAPYTNQQQQPWELIHAGQYCMCHLIIIQVITQRVHNIEMDVVCLYYMIFNYIHCLWMVYLLLRLERKSRIRQRNKSTESQHIHNNINNNDNSDKKSTNGSGRVQSNQI